MNKEAKEAIRQEWAKLGFLPDVAEKVIKTCEKAVADKVASIRGEVEKAKFLEVAFDSKRLALKQYHNETLDKVLSLPSLSLPASREENV